MTGDTDRVLADIDDVIDDYVTWDGISADAMRWTSDSAREDTGGHEVLRASYWSEMTTWHNQWPTTWCEEPRSFAYVPTFDIEGTRRAFATMQQALVPHFAQVQEAYAAFGKVVRAAADANHPAFARLTMGDDYRRHHRSCPLCNPAGNPKPLAANGAEYRRRTRSRSRRNRR